MADDFTVQWDENALRQVLRESPELQAHFEQLGEQGVRFGQDNAPDAPPLREGYIDSWVTSVGEDEQTRDPLLVIANTNWKALWIEFGTAPHQTGSKGAAVSTPAHHVLDHMIDHLRG